jgi:hypothetical protein
VKQEVWNDCLPYSTSSSLFRCLLPPSKPTARIILFLAEFHLFPWQDLSSVICHAVILHIEASPHYLKADPIAYDESVGPKMLFLVLTTIVHLVLATHASTLTGNESVCAKAPTPFTDEFSGMQAVIDISERYPTSRSSSDELWQTMGSANWEIGPRGLFTRQVRLAYLYVDKHVLTARMFCRRSVLTPVMFLCAQVRSLVVLLHTPFVRLIQFVLVRRRLILIF